MTYSIKTKMTCIGKSLISSIRRRLIIGPFSLYVMVVCSIQWSCTDPNALFTTVDTSDSGIDFENKLTETDDFNILDYLYFYNGGGVAIGDINNDGLPDIYFSGNQVKNKLYLNKGNLLFEDITGSAGVEGSSDWNTGVVMGDVNADGWLDIYVCAVVGIRGLDGYNELFINNGDNTFTESAAKYGLDFDSYSSTAALLDFDKDGDLDMYLLNHAIHTQESFGHANLREKRTYETGDKLLRNDGGKFTDVSEEAGIYGGVNGYGLGISVADFNQDGYPDVYVGNDFHEDDYYYLNNGDGTFSESIKQYFGQTTRFSMGNDVADLNHDGWPDLMSLDMLPEDEKVLKSSEGDEDVNILRLRTQRYGYHYQFTRNMLHYNQGGTFIEAAWLNGVAATDWSWSALFADYDQDGEQDLFISNGIPKRPNDLDYIRFVSNDQIKNKIDATKLVDQRALELMPSGAVRNYIFQGQQGAGFKDKSDQWIPDEALFSTATALGDLDLDGDIDVVINNNDSPARIYKNTTDGRRTYLKLKFNSESPNTIGIGTKVYAYQGGELQYKELYNVRGFQASSEPMVHFGFNNAPLVDSVRIIWPNGTSQRLERVATNQMLTINPENNSVGGKSEVKKSVLFKAVNDNLGIDFEHREDRYIDFDRQKLMPYQASDRGPAVAVGDLTGDGRPDLFFGGSKYTSSRIYAQTESGFDEIRMTAIQQDSIKEDNTAAIADLNGDGRNDILIGSGGADFYNQMKPLLDSYFVQSDDGFQSMSLPDLFENAGAMATYDYDEDGDVDVFIGNHSVSNDFGAIPNSVLLKNDNGTFTSVDHPALEQCGMVTDAVWSDYNNDGAPDLIVVGEWMSPRFFRNVKGVLEEDQVLKGRINGLWQAITPFDIDEDGDQDYMLGNWGWNSKLIASPSAPMKMYYGDLDGNGNTETILATSKNGEYYTVEGLDALATQMVGLRKTYTNYKSFAGQSVDQILKANDLRITSILEVDVLASGYLKNDNGVFEFIPFERELQVAPMMAFMAFDFDGDGKQELLAGGNYFGVKPYHGRLGSFGGALIQDETTYQMGYDVGLNWLNKSIRGLNILTVGSDKYLLTTINNDKAQVYKIVR